ncbi:MAG: hypothetical protein IT391_08785 [Nitrospira sp.]|nr:hypothetical protein [Nitrospira sp.]
MKGTEEEEGGIIAQAPDDVNDEKPAVMSVRPDWDSAVNGPGGRSREAASFAMAGKRLPVKPMRFFSEPYE